MLMISRKVEYGLMAVLHMAEADADRVWAAKSLSRELDVPGELLGKVMQALSRAGVVEAVQGARGGYRLNQGMDTLTLGELVEAIDGPIRLTRCQHGVHACDRAGRCTLQEPMISVHNRLQAFFRSIPVRELARSARTSRRRASALAGTET